MFVGMSAVGLPQIFAPSNYTHTCMHTYVHADDLAMCPEFELSAWILTSPTLKRIEEDFEVRIGEAVFELTLMLLFLACIYTHRGMDGWM